MIYKTEFVNLRASRYPVIDQDHKLVMTLKGGETKFVETDNPLNIFARYSRVAYLPENKVVAEPNPDWKSSLGGWTIDIVNESAQDPEKLNVETGDWVLVPLGFTRTVRVPIISPLIRYERITLRTERRRMPARDNSAVSLELDMTVQDRVERPQKDMDEINRQLKDRSGIKYGFGLNEKNEGSK
jgi:hypothetical protein